ncbi:3'-5' exonuclease, partial [Klebsiella pneumoniae]|uniref:3'-5' exonuclease n=1 Tax=Klebsiella pneumoniae TaxID=573 RepID=UPI002731EA2F
LWSDLGEGEPIKLMACDTEEHEAERTVAHFQLLRNRLLHDHPGSDKADWSNFAILYRANHQARPFEQALRKANIPYKVSGGQSFF